MARFDVYEKGGIYLLDCQSDVLHRLNSRFAVPLMVPEEAPTAGARLNPKFEFERRELVMVTQFAGALPLREMGAKVGSLDGERTEILNALDMLISGC